MENVLLVAYLLIVLALIAVILLQRSEGGGLGMGGNAGGLMTVRGSANLLTRTTAILAALFFATGFAHAQNKAWPRAAEMLANADRLQPGDFNTLYYLGYVFENQRKYAQALDAYNRAFEASGRTNQDVRASIERVMPLARNP